MTADKAFPPQIGIDSMKTVSLVVASLVAALAQVPVAVAQSPKVNSVQQAYDLLHKGELSAADAAALRDFFEKRYAGKDLRRGEHRHLLQSSEDGGGYAAWCLRAPREAHVTVVAEKGRRWPLVRLGDGDLWAWAEKFGNFTSVHYRYDIDGRRIGGGREGRFGFESYTWTADSLPQEGAPRGELIEMDRHTSRKYFPGAERDWWIYVPAQYDADSDEPAKLIVFNDGGGFTRGEGNACTVLDNLIHQKKIPVMIAVFVNPGTFPARDAGRQPTSNRSNEYDTCTPRFATFLDEEILPLVRKRYRISDDPWDHAICGSSSGASCAFTAAWHRNDLFRRVISFVGSYCDFRPTDAYPVYGDRHVMQGDQFGPWKTAHDYPALIRKTEPRREIKVFLQDGENDLDNRLGNWFLNNQRMAAALAYGGYDYKFVAGQGMHSKKHGMSILPEILVWLWNDQAE